MKLRLPSFQSILKAYLKVFVRFPFACLVTILGVYCTIALIESVVETNRFDFLANIIVCCLMGMPAMVAAQLICEHFRIPWLWKYLLKLAALGLLVPYYFSLPDNIFEGPHIHLYRWALLFIAVHLLVAVSPFIRAGNQEAIWKFNETLLSTMVIGGLFSFALMLGIDLAIFSLDALFDVDIDEETYAEVAVVVFGWFNTSYFLYHIPSRSENESSSSTVLPAAWKFFSAYILVPLVLLYLVILYCYEGKIIIEWDYPRGWVSNLIIGFAVLGILAQLLVYPIRQDEKNKWIKNFSRFFFFAIIPLIVLLILAIMRRVSDYGITEERYFLILTAIWLSFITIYFLIFRFNNIKMIPMSLLLLSVIAAYGPVSAFAVSQRSQLHRLTEILQRNNMIRDGKAIATQNNSQVNEKDKEQINDIVDYLVDHYWTNPFENFFTGKFPVTEYRSDSFRYSDFEEAKKNIVTKLGLEYSRYYGRPSFSTKYFEVNKNEPLVIHGYDHLIEIKSYDGNVNLGDSLTISLNEKSGIVTITQHDDQLELKLFPLAKQLYDNNHDDIPRNQFTISDSTSHYCYQLALETLSINFSETLPKEVTYFSGHLIWRKKK